MKILHILYSGLGGHGNVFFSMVDADTTGERQYEAIFFGIEEVRNEYIKKAVSRNIPYHFIKKKPGADPASRKRIRQIVKQSAPDIVFLHGSSFIFYAKPFFSFSRSPRIIVRETQPNHLKTKPQLLAMAYALMAADKVVFLNTEYRDEVRSKMRLFFSPERTAVVPNGIDLKVFKPQPKEKDSFLRIGMQSRLSPTKDHITLIKAFDLCRRDLPASAHLQLLIAGDGTCRPALESLVHKLEISDCVIFTGMLEEEELPAFINSLDIYVHATFGEMMSTAIMQVMACRFGVIASDVFGVNNMIAGGVNGILVPVQNEKMLADAMLSLINDRDAADALAENAYQFAKENFSNNLMLKRYLNIFNAVNNSLRKRT